MLNIGPGSFYRPAVSMQVNLRPASAKLPRPRTELAFSGLLRKAPVEPEIIMDIAQFNQGSLPNNQFLAAILMVAQVNPDAIEQLVGKPDQRGRYTIRFPGAPRHPIVVDPKNFAPIPWKETRKGSQVNGHQYIRLLEAAFAKLLMEREPDRFKRPKLFELLRPSSIRNVYHSPNLDPEIFSTAFAYEMLTGDTPVVYVQPDSHEQIEKLRSQRNRLRHITYLDKKNETPEFFPKVQAHLDRFARNPNMFPTAFLAKALGAQPKANRLDMGRYIRAYHTYVLKGVNPAAKTAILKGTLDTSIGLEIPIIDIPKYFFKMYVAANP
jgi:hypothetical protein